MTFALWTGLAYRLAPLTIANQHRITTDRPRLLAYSTDHQKGAADKYVLQHVVLSLSVLSLSLSPLFLFPSLTPPPSSSLSLSLTLHISVTARGSLYAVL